MDIILNSNVFVYSSEAVSLGGVWQQTQPIRIDIHQ